MLTIHMYITLHVIISFSGALIFTHITNINQQETYLFLEKEKRTDRKRVGILLYLKIL